MPPLPPPLVGFGPRAASVPEIGAPAATVSGGYWYHRQQQTPAREARDPAFQDQLMDRLAALTGIALF
jgi:hypothetical protein